MYGQFQDGAEYSFAGQGVMLSSNEYLLITHNYSARCLLAFLNSKVSEWMLGNLTGSLGGNAKIGQKSNFLRLPVAQLPQNQQAEFDKIVDTILSAKKENRNTDMTEEVVDSMVYRVYGLTEEEINVIENG